MKKAVFGEGESTSQGKGGQKPSLVSKMEEATAFKFLVKTDTLDDRREAQRTGLEELYGLYAKAQSLEDQKKVVQAATLIIGEMQKIYFKTTSAWARSREGEYFRELYGLFLARVEAYGDLLPVMPNLFKNLQYVMNAAYTNLDVEPQTPIVLFAPQTNQGGFDINKALESMQTKL